MQVFQISPLLFFLIGLSPVVCASTAIYFFKKSRGIKISASREVLKWILTVYILFIGALALFPVHYVANSTPLYSPKQIYIMPFKIISLIFKFAANSQFPISVRLKTVIENLGGGLLLLFPLGFLLPFYGRFFRKFVPCLLFGFVVSLFIEVAQFVETAYSLSYNRATGTDFVILNIIGLCFGYLLNRELNEK
jgi:glycopeptide antibiotics resistance protein